MEITIQEVESLDNKLLVSIWFGDKQVMLTEDEFERFKEEFESFENNKTALEVPVQEQFKRKIVQGNLSEVKIFCIETN